MMVNLLNRAAIISIFDTVDYDFDNRNVSFEISASLHSTDIFNCKNSASRVSPNSIRCVITFYFIAYSRTIFTAFINGR